MIGRPHTAGDELRFALAGPMVTAVIALAFGALAPALPASTPSAVRGLVGYETQVNLLILGFNLVPAFPLDGGRVARALLWRRTSDVRRATEIASAIGRGFGYLLVGGGVFLWFASVPGGLWFAVVGVFVMVAASAERMQEQVVAMLTGVSVGAVMSHPAITLPAALAHLLDRSAFRRVGRAVVVDVVGRPVGIVSVTDIERMLRAMRIGGRPGASRRPPPHG